MKLIPSGIEDHPTGTINKNGIINGNWRRVNALLNPDLSDTDPLYGTLYGVLEAAVNGQRKMETVTSAASITLSFATSRMKRLTLLSDADIFATAYKAGREFVLLVTASGADRTITWYASYVWASPIITVIPAGKTARFVFYSTSTAASGTFITGTIGP